MLIFIAILGIGFLILVHELGHFLAAKAFGMRAEKFYMGFPPAMIKRKIGETEYGIGFIPLGGYVKITGMNREEEVPEDVQPRAYYAQPIWQRIITISAGPLMNLLTAAVLFFIFYAVAMPNYQPTNSVAAIQTDSGAQRAGLQPNDKLLAVNGVSSDDPQALRQELQSRPDQTVMLLIERDGRQMTIEASVGRDQETGKGLLGVLFATQLAGTKTLPVTESLKNSVTDLGFITKEVFIAIKNLFISSQSREELSSPIGIVAVSSETIKLGWGVYLRVLGFISLQLAIFNLLPLLPLDGGHVLFNVVEKIRGKPLKKEIFEKVSFVGLAFFVILFIIGITNDIQRIMGPGFQLGP